MINLGIRLSDSSDWQQSSALGNNSTDKGTGTSSSTSNDMGTGTSGSQDTTTKLLAMLIMAALEMMKQSNSSNDNGTGTSSSDPFSSKSSTDNTMQQLTNSLLNGSMSDSSNGGGQLSQASSPLTQEVGKMMDTQPETFSSPAALASTGGNGESAGASDVGTGTTSLGDTGSKTSDLGGNVLGTGTSNNSAATNSTSLGGTSDTSTADVGTDTATQANNTSNSAVNMFPTASSSPNVVDETIVVKAGETFDGKGQTFTASSKLGKGDQAEDQKPLFVLEDGATLKNVVIGDNGADGVHTKGDATVDNVHWTNVGEDALTMKKSGDVTIKNSSAKGADDKIFQLNAAGTLTLDNVQADDFGKLVRTNGGQQADWEINLNNVKASNGHNALVQSDSNTVKVNATNVSTDNVKGMYKLPESGQLNIA